MSIHVQLTEEAQAKLKSQQKTSTISSVLITALTLTLLGLLLYFVFLKPLTIEVPTIVTYQGTQDEEAEISKKKITNQVQKKPAAASSSMAKVIASTSPSNVTIPVPEVNTPEPSPDFGDSNDFGAGWGGEGSGFGGAVSFFGQKTKGKNICFVIDYSLSMKARGRDNLMRKELVKSLDSLSNGMNYQLIFFAGPIWVAGDEFKPDSGPVNKTQSGEFTAPDGAKYTWKKGRGWSGKSRTAEWVTVSDDALKLSRKYVRNTPLLLGTNWGPPLEMAMAMSPPPDVINFMTDGATSNTDKIIKDISELARRRGTTINTVALMEPKAKAGMLKLAKQNKGQFTLVEEGGKRTIIGAENKN